MESAQSCRQAGVDSAQCARQAQTFASLSPSVFTEKVKHGSDIDRTRPTQELGVQVSLSPQSVPRRPPDKAEEQSLPGWHLVAWSPQAELQHITRHGSFPGPHSPPCLQPLVLEGCWQRQELEGPWASPGTNTAFPVPPRRPRSLLLTPRCLPLCPPAAPAGNACCPRCPGLQPWTPIPHTRWGEGGSDLLGRVWACRDARRPDLPGFSSN